MINSFLDHTLRQQSSRAIALQKSGVGLMLPLMLCLFCAVVQVCASASPRDFQQGQSSTALREDARVLAPGETVRRSIRGGEAHLYRLTLAPGQYAHVIVKQQGADVAVRLSDAGARLLIKVDNPNGRYGPEALSVLAQGAESYSIEVLSEDKAAPPGDYELKLEGPREALEVDRQRVAAERIFAEAQQLRSEAAKKAGEERSQKFKDALGKYKEAADLWHALGDAGEEGYAYCNAGRSYRALGLLNEALDSFNRALSRLRDGSDIAGQAFVLNEMGAVYGALGQPFQALDVYNQAIELRSSLNDVGGKGQLYNNVGLIYSHVGYQSKAIENFEKALTIWRETGLRRMEMNTLNNAANAYAEMGDVTVAFRKYQEVSAFCDQDNYTYLKPYALNGLGLVYDTWAEPDEALKNYEAAQQLFHAQNSRKEEAEVLDNIGLVYANLGDPDRALENFQKALPIRKDLKEPKGTAKTLSNIGYAHTLLGNYREALRNLNDALPLSQQSSDKRFEAYTIFRLGMAYLSLGQPQEALQRFRQALEIQREVEDSRGQAITLDKMAEAHARSGEFANSLDNYKQALQHWRAVGDKQGEALSLYGMAVVERNQRDLTAARDSIEQAISIIESLRVRISGPQLRMTYFAAKQDFYALDINVRMLLYELGRSSADMEAALSASERSRARRLLDTLAEAHVSLIKGMSAQDREKIVRLEQEISRLAQNSLLLRNLKRKEESEVVERRLAALVNEVDDLQTRMRRASTTRVAAKGSQALEPREIQKLLDDDTLLLEYALGNEHSYLWAVTRTEIVPYLLPGRAEIEKAAVQLRQALTEYEPRRHGEDGQQYLERRNGAARHYKQAALELSRMVLGPVLARLGNKRLAIVADGALQYIPFEALPLPSRPPYGQTQLADANYTPLILLNEVIYQPSASTLSLLRTTQRRTATKTLAVIADPVFDSHDKRVHLRPGEQKAEPEPRALSQELSRALRDIGDTGSGNADLRLERLDYTAAEAEAITSDAPPGSWMKALNFEASRATAMSSSLAQYGIVHFATHSILNDKHPELSGIVLSMVDQWGRPQDGYLRLRDIYNMDLPADLVVLSACRTAIGKEVHGEGLVGLTRGFMYAGAFRVIASLWNVEDEATARLMKNFYRHMLRRKMSVSAALRQAKIEMINSPGEWRAPYYWSGFVLQGDWK